MISDSSKKSIVERRKIEFIVRHIWGFYRPFVSKHLTKRCVQCAISATAASGKAFDKRGLCTTCVEFNTQPSTKNLSQNKTVNERLEKELNEILASHVNSAKSQYDALIFFSGGKDSSYILYRLMNDHPQLRILAVTVDNGFMSPIAIENVNYAISELKIAHIFIKPPTSLYEQLFSYIFTNHTPNGSAEYFDVVDGELRFDIGRHLAAQMNIPLIITGLTRDQVTTYNGSLTIKSDRRFEQAKREQVGPYRVDKLPLSENNKAYFWDGTLYPKTRIAQVIFPLVAWNKSETEIAQTVVSNGLIREGYQSPILTNHLLIPLMALVDVTKIGYASWEPEFCQMIREGRADKKYWKNLFEIIEYSAKTGKLIGSTIKPLLEKLQLTRKQVGLK